MVHNDGKIGSNILGKFMFSKLTSRLEGAAAARLRPLRSP